MWSGCSVYQGFPSVYTSGNGYLGVVRHYDGVVHQHTHGDDKSCQGRSVESDAEERHDEQCTSDRENQRRADEQTGTESHHQHDNDNHDQDGFDQVDDKSVVGFVGDLVFEVEALQFQSHRHEGEELVQFYFYVLTRLHYISLRVGGNTDADSPFPVHVHDVGWRVEITFLDHGYVAQFHLSGFGGDYLVADIVYVGIHSVGCYP